MKKLLALILSVLMVAVCFAGCGTKGSTLADVKEAGKLVMATSPDFPPFESLEGDKVVGIEPELMAMVADELGVELEIQQIDFDSVLSGIQAAKFDVGVSGITVTDARKKNMLFTNPYYEAAQAIVVKEGSAITKKADLDGKKVSVQSGTTAEDFCTTNGYNVTSYKANADAQVALTSAKVDAWVIDNCTAAEMVEKYNAENDQKLVILDEAMTTEPYAFAFAYGSEDLVAEINKIVDKLLADGTVEDLFEKYELVYEAPKN